MPKELKCMYKTKFKLKAKKRILKSELPSNHASTETWGNMSIIKKIFLVVIMLIIEHLIIKTLMQKSPKSSGRDRKYLLYIMVLTAPGNTEERQNIRETWLNDVIDRNSCIKFNFFIGTKNINLEDLDTLVKEQTEYKDIIFLREIKESYVLTTYKVLKMLKWAYEHINAVYYFKIDDDCYLSVDRFINILTNEGLPREKLLLGSFLDSNPVHDTGKWADLDWSLCGEYLPYAMGAGYLLTHDLVKFIAVNNDKLGFHRNEDTAIGAWIAGLNVTYQREKRTYLAGPTCKEDGYLFHDYPTIDLKRIHQLWVTQGKTCSE